MHGIGTKCLPRQVANSILLRDSDDRRWRVEGLRKRDGVLASIQPLGREAHPTQDGARLINLVDIVSMGTKFRGDESSDMAPPWVVLLIATRSAHADSRKEPTDKHSEARGWTPSLRRTCIVTRV